MSTSPKPRVVVYRIQGCPYCIDAVDLLLRRGVPFTEIALDDHPDRRAFTASIKPGHRTVPLIVIDGTPLGGFDDLCALDARGGLATLA
ncbi:MAG: glutaredoxin domain-containing protein [Planctomycetota bacterium]